MLLLYAGGFLLGVRGRGLPGGGGVFLRGGRHGRVLLFAVQLLQPLRLPGGLLILFLLFLLILPGIRLDQGKAFIRRLLGAGEALLSLFLLLFGLLDALAHLFLIAQAVIPGALHVVDHAAQHADAGLVQLLQGALDLGDGGAVIAHHIQHGVGDLVQAQGVGFLADGRRVQDHVFVLFGELLDQIHDHAVHGHGVVLQHRGQDIQIAGQGGDGLLLGDLAAVEGVEGVLIIHIAHEQGAQGGVLEIEVHQQGAVLHIGQLNGQVGRYGGAALPVGGRGHIEAVMVFLGAQAVAQDVGGGGIVLRHHRGADVVLHQDGALLAEEFLVPGDQADGLQAKQRLHILHVGQGGMHQHLHHRKADAGRQAQQGQEDGNGLAGAAGGLQPGHAIVDDVQMADGQRLGHQLVGAVDDVVPDGHAFLVVAPLDGHFQDLGVVIGADVHARADIQIGYAQQTLLVDHVVEHAHAAHHVDDSVHHVLRQVVVVLAGGVVAIQVGAVVKTGVDGHGAADIIGGQRGLHIGHAGQQHAEHPADKGQSNDDFPPFLNGKQQVADAKLDSAISHTPVSSLLTLIF